MKNPPREDRLRRWVAGGSITLLGVAFLAVPIYDISNDVTELSWSIGPTLIENVPFLLLAGGLVVGGGWLVRTDWETRQVTAVAYRTLLTAGAVMTLLGAAMAIQLYVLGRLKPGVLALDGMLVGAVASFALSISTVRSNVFRRQVSHKRELNDRLERLCEAVSELTSATTRAEVYEILEDMTASVAPAVPFRVVVDGETIVEHGGEADAVDSSGTAGTVPIGDHGVIDLPNGALEDHERSTLELFCSHVDETIQRVEREDRLRDERDLLKFVNRTLRHDLIGDVSLIEARLKMVDRNADLGDDQEDNLTVALERARKMEEFIRTMRTYMRSVLNDEYELQAVALRPAIDEEIAAVEETYPEVTVERGQVPEVSIQADGLFHRALANLFENAVQHNASPTPRIDVDAERDGGVVRLRIADNGPGISESRRESIFAQSERGPDSDGTGFGLHLVQDIVEGYGGAVGIRENDPHGAVFELELPIASRG